MTLAEFKAHERLSLKALAELIGHPATTVHGWLHNDRLPALGALAGIEVATGGAVTAADLRPDVARLFERAA